MLRPSHPPWHDNLDSIFYGAEPYSTTQTQIVNIYVAIQCICSLLIRLQSVRFHSTVYISKYVFPSSRYPVLELLGPERIAVIAYILRLFHLSIKINGEKYRQTSNVGGVELGPPDCEGVVNLRIGSCRSNI